MAECQEPGCGARLRSDNTSGWCQTHRDHFQVNKRKVPLAEVKRCGTCGGRLNVNNKTGHCQRTPECSRESDRVQRELRPRSDRNTGKCLGCGAAVQPRSFTCVKCMALARKLNAILKSLEKFSNG